jgi:O-Antigen ligase
MRRALLVAATVVLLAGPAVLAFFTGAYFDGPRAVAAGVAWALVLVLALVGPLPLPRSWPGWAALAGLAGLAAWSAVSAAWAPLAEPVSDNVQRLLLYVAVLLLAIALLRDRLAARAVEPVLALGGVVVIGYGLAGRLLPGIVHESPSSRSGNRLEQPITYWNAEGLVAAIGLVLCVRLAGDPSRPRWLRLAAAASCAPLGAGLYLAYSRGAIAAAAIGCLVLLAAAPTRPQLRAALNGLLAVGLAAAASAAFRSVAVLHGSRAQQERHGVFVLVLIVAIGLAAALIAERCIRAERRGALGLGRLRYARRLPAVAAIAVVLCVAGVVAGGLGEKANHLGDVGSSPSRLASVQSLRYEYWRVALRGWERHPVRGLGSGGFRVLWREERRVAQGANEVHSIVLEMLTELGIPGLLLFALFLGGIAVSGRRALRFGAPLAPGACAAASAWLLHATIDWDWQIPAVTLPFIVLAGGLVALGELPEGGVAPEHTDVREGGVRRALRGDPQRGVPLAG